MHGNHPGLFFGLGRNSRNDPIRLADPHPLTDYGNDVDTGNAGLDGFTAISKSSPRYQGCAPMVDGALGRCYQGPADDWEQ
jgi:hypothetical protein